MVNWEEIINDKSCCFIGPTTRERGRGVFAIIKRLIFKLAFDEGIVTYYFGNDGSFSNASYHSATDLKVSHTHPPVKRILVPVVGQNLVLDDNSLECRQFLNNWDIPFVLRKVYDEILEWEHEFEESDIAEEYRNYLLVDTCDVCVFYLEDEASEDDPVRIAYNYAVSKNKRVINVYEKPKQKRTPKKVEN